MIKAYANADLEYTLGLTRHQKLVLYVLSLRMDVKRTTAAELRHFKVTQTFGVTSAVRIESTIDPVSLQADSERKAKFMAALAAAVKKSSDRIFIGDVKAEITWFISEERRYHTHIVADIDNIIKPLFDAITGPSGILIDDNQVQQFGASWEDAKPGDLKFTMAVEALSPYQFILRENIEFVDFGRPYGCMLIGNMPTDARLDTLKSVTSRIRAQQALIDAGIAKEVARMGMPAQRFFPAARLSRFKVTELPEAAGSLVPDSETLPDLFHLKED